MVESRLLAENGRIHAWDWESNTLFLEPRYHTPALYYPLYLSASQRNSVRVQGRLEFCCEDVTAEIPPGFIVVFIIDCMCFSLAYVDILDSINVKESFKFRDFTNVRDSFWRYWTDTRPEVWKKEAWTKTINTSSPKVLRTWCLSYTNCTTPTVFRLQVLPRLCVSSVVNWVLECLGYHAVLEVGRRSSGLGRLMSHRPRGYCHPGTALESSSGLIGLFRASQIKSPHVKSAHISLRRGVDGVRLGEAGWRY